MDRDRERERERERLGERTGYDQGWKSSDRDREQQQQRERELRDKDRDRESEFQGGSYVSGGRDRSQQDYYNQPYFQPGFGQQQQHQQQYGTESRRDFTRYSPYDTLRSGLGGLGDQQKLYQGQPERYSTSGSGSGFGYGQESRYPVLGGGIQYQQYPAQFGGSGFGFAGNLPGGYPENVSFGQSWLPSRSYYSGSGFRETPYWGGAGAGGRDWSLGSRLGFGEQEQLGSYGSQGISSGLGFGSYDAGQSWVNPQSRSYQQQQQQQLYKNQCRYTGKESCDINLAEATGVFYPNVDIYEDRNNMYLDFELPGIKREDVYLHIAGAEDHRVLNVSGMIRDKPSLDARYLQKNRKTGRFKLKIHLPDNIRTEEITADLTDGILTATIPKTEEISSGIQTGVRKRIDITSRLPQFKTTGVTGGTTQEKFGEAERTQVQGVQSVTPQQAQITPQPPQLGQQAQQQQLYRPGQYTSQT